ncbi:putative C-_U-editing enzyme APOBEC-4 [Rana temporaria]|uniref:putative C->U-editing enzyme APOBEC-4 n=1 Tax=Rana temporaria TaxID=8407 RepID=UPI001AAE050D|nr:putative C->U-editing enzyme APOBEC-4 [Rana temporaria]XP_040215730.1 putative C->U-editing enzyme APOBEC-4 [Rana temporaria]
METVFQEFSSYHGTLVKPYYWLNPNQNCSKCPYHIRTGEESRVTYGEFYETFGFPYGPTMHEDKQLIFYEIKSFNGTVIQKGQVTGCAASNIHAEAMFFEKHGYLDYLLYQHDSVGYITLYANFTPCNEYGHYCISKMYDILIKYTQMRLDIYFSQMYHVEVNFPSAVWNRDALKSLAGHWPRVTLNPLSDGIWKTVLCTFVKEVPETTMNQPILPIRASADRHNAYMIHVITGIKPYFVEEPPVPQPEETRLQPKYQRHNVKYNVAPQPPTGFQQYFPFFALQIPFVPAFQSQRELMTKPKQVVRHLNMPMNLNEKANKSEFIPSARKFTKVVNTERTVWESDKETTRNKRKKKKQ